MGTEPGKTRFHVRADLEALDWGAVHRSLVEDGKVSEARSRRLIREFIAKLRIPVHAHWLRGRGLSPDEGRVLRALCEIMSADTLTIHSVSNTSALTLGSRCEAEISFSPFSTPGEGAFGRVGAIYAVSMPGVHVVIDTFPRALAFYSIVLLAGVVFYAVVFGMLLYSLSVFLLFLADPALMTVAATNHPSLGLALLCFLVALAGLSGKAVRNITRLLRQKLFSSRTGSTL